MKAIVVAVVVASTLALPTYGAESDVPVAAPAAKCAAPFDPALDAPQCIDAGTPTPRIGIWAPREYVANVLGKLERAQADKLAAERALVEKEKPVLVAGHSTTTVIIVAVVSAIAVGTVAVLVDRGIRASK